MRWTPSIFEFKLLEAPEFNGFIWGRRSEILPIIWHCNSRDWIYKENDEQTKTPTLVLSWAFLILWSCWQLCRLHDLIVVSAEQVTKEFPCGLKTTAFTAPKAIYYGSGVKPWTTFMRIMKCGYITLGLKTESSESAVFGTGWENSCFRLHGDMSNWICLRVWVGWMKEYQLRPLWILSYFSSHSWVSKFMIFTILSFVDIASLLSAQKAILRSKPLVLKVKISYRIYTSRYWDLSASPEISIEEYNYLNSKLRLIHR